MKSLFMRFIKLARSRGLSNSMTARVGQGLVLFIALYFTVAVGILPPQYSLEEGQISPETIYAPRTVIDHTATNLARAQAAEEIEDVYIRDASIAGTVMSNISVLPERLLEMYQELEELAEIEEQPDDDISGEDDSEQQVGDDQDIDNEDSLDNDEDVQEDEDEDQEQGLEQEAADPVESMKEEMIAELLEFTEVEDEDVAWALLSLTKSDVEHFWDLTLENINVLMQAGIKEDEVQENRQSIVDELMRAQADQVIISVVSAGLDEHFTHNRFFSAEDTENERRQARDQVEEIRILRGAKIVDRGETVTPEHISQLSALGMLQATVPYGYYVGLGLLLLGVFCVWGYYLFKMRPKVLHQPSRVWLVGLIILLTLWAAKLFGGQLIEVGSPYLVPVSMATLLLTIIFDVNMALFFGTTLSVVVGLTAGGEVNAMIFAFVSSVVGAYSVVNVNQRSDLTRAGLVVAGANVVTIVALTLIGDGLVFTSASVQRTLLSVGMGVASGILAAVFAIGLLPFFEITFGITTTVGLLELANPNQQPLKRLLLEAPGTYHHSIMVGNLAEAAAEAVGADPILARVGAYYHDLGKLTRPYFFIENQFKGANPHDRIPPSLSSMILTAHVRGGLKLAKEYKLPPVISDIIVQHHGTTLTGFFYHRAVSELGSKDKLLEDKFRYGGPKPQFKEAAIIMLADSVEAAVRSLAQPNQSRIQTMVTKIIQDKLGDGQLDECDLTLKDLNLISQAFVQVLTGMYHKRIAYPTEKDLAKLGS